MNILPQHELQDFENIWENSLIDNTTGNVKNPGGKSLGGVDYEDLIAWCSGNSLSIDYDSSTVFSDIMVLLISKYRSALYRKDKINSPLNEQSGILWADLEKLFGKPTGNKTWADVEDFLQHLIHLGHVSVYNNSNARSKHTESRVRKMINKGENPSSNMTIIGILYQSYNDRGKAHLRLNPERGWETYIRDHFGSPNGIKNIIAGSLIPGNIKTIPTMPRQVHLVYAATFSRMRSDEGWNRAQYIIRQRLTDYSITNNTGGRVPLDYYYEQFYEQKCIHMADVCFVQLNDTASPKYRLEACPLSPSSAQKWDVIIEPAMIRWRTLARTRGRGIGGSGTSTNASQYNNKSGKGEVK